MRSVKRSMKDPVVRLQDTIRPLLLAPLGAVVVFAALGLAPGHGLPGLAFLIAMVWGYSLAAASVLVLPVLILAPRLRRPRKWIVMPWGALAAIVSGAAWTGTPRLYVPFAIAGAASGLVYAVVSAKSATSIESTTYPP